MDFFAVFIGGGLGAIFRYIISLTFPIDISKFPYCTLLANFIGCLIATIIFSYFILKNDTNDIYKIFLLTGFCGGLTTLSTFSIEILSYLQQGALFKGILYLILTFLVCIIAIILGLMFAKHYL